MIHITENDILDAKEQIVVHQVNCQGVFNKGIAGQIRKKYPKAYQEYYDKVNQFKSRNKQHLLLGTVQFVRVEEDKWICNLFGQEYYGYDQLYTSYEALKQGFVRLKHVAIKRNKSIASPYYIGSGLAGGDTEKIHQIMNTIFNNHPINLYKKE